MPWTRRWLIVIALVALALVGGGWASVQIGRPHLYRHLAAQQAARLRSDDAALRNDAAEQLRRLGLYGIDPLVAALLAENEPTADTAQQALETALDDWRQLPPAEGSQRVARLARQLASRIDALPPARRFAAARWTQQMLIWPLDRQAVDVPRVLADCELLAAACTPLRIEQLLAALPEPPVVAETRPQVAADKSEPEPNEPAAEPEPPLPDLALLPPAAKPTPPEPQPAPDPAPQFTEPKRFLAPEAHKLAPPRTIRKPRSLEVTKPAAASEPYAWLREETDIGVMRQLHSDEPALIEAAQADLVRRGYRPRDLKLCRTLVHPDADQRRIFAQALPRIPGIDARPWLLQLSEDRDPEVRRIATAILRTSQDPEVQRRLKGESEERRAKR